MIDPNILDSIQSFLEAMANVIAATSIIPLTLFVFFYGTKKVYGRPGRVYTDSWRSTDIGRVLMYQKIAWVVFIGFVVVNLFTEDYVLQEPLRVLIYTALVVLFWRVFFILRKLQKEVEPRRGNETEVSYEPAKKDESERFS